MEDEVDLREYVRVVLRWWRLIVGMAVVAAVTALAVSLLVPAAYEATALVAATTPRYALQFDPRIEAMSDDKPTYAAYPQLATSDELLQALLARLSPAPRGVETLADLREMVKARAGADPSVVQLTVRSSDPQEAARTANAWAKLFVARANQLYGAGSDEQVRFFEGQAQQAEAKLEGAERALVEFQGQNEADILEAQLASARQELRDCLAERAEIGQAVRKVQALRARVSSQPAGERARLADELTALLLQTRVLGGGAPEFQLQSSGASLPAALQTAGELTASLDRLMTALEGQVEKLDSHVATLRPQILALQQRLQEARTGEDRLTRERDVARETYVSLARKTEETRIAAQDAGSEAKLASKAAVPERPVGTRTPLKVAAVGALGLMLGVFGALAVEWWRQGAQASDSQQRRDVPDPAQAALGQAQEPGLQR